MADAMMMFLGEAHGVNWYWAQPGEFENPGAYYWDGAKNVLCVPHLSAPEAPAQNDPMDTPLPCDVRIGNGIHRKGTSLRTLVNRAQRLHEAAFGPAPTKEEAAANLEQLRSAVIAPAQASAVDEREAFEAWAIDQPYIAAKNLWDERSRYGEEEYESHEVQLMWEAWKARATLAQKGGK